MNRKLYIKNYRDSHIIIYVSYVKMFTFDHACLLKSYTDGRALIHTNMFFYAQNSYQYYVHCSLFDEHQPHCIKYYNDSIDTNQAICEYSRTQTCNQISNNYAVVQLLAENMYMHFIQGSISQLFCVGYWPPRNIMGC